MISSDDLTLGGLAALGAIGSVCAVLLKSTHQNLTTLDIMRREAHAATDKLRKELQDNDNTIFKLQELCADYRLAIAKLEAERNLLRTTVETLRSQAKERERQGNNSSSNPKDVL